MMQPVKQMLEEGIRRVTVRVNWDEPGLPNQQVEVVTFYTDMRRIPLVPQMGNLPGASGSTPGSSTSPPSGSTPSSGTVPTTPPGGSR
jgi:hypothetical protein